jgi:hypothetical protein
LAEGSSASSLEDGPTFFGKDFEISEDPSSIVLRMVTGDALLSSPLRHSVARKIIFVAPESEDDRMSGKPLSSTTYFDLHRSNA